MPRNDRDNLAKETRMAITIVETGGGARAYLLAGLAVLRAAAGLAVFGARNFGRGATIERRTGRVRPV